MSCLHLGGSVYPTLWSVGFDFVTWIVTVVKELFNFFLMKCGYTKVSKNNLRCYVWKVIVIYGSGRRVEGYNIIAPLSKSQRQ